MRLVAWIMDLKQSQLWALSGVIFVAVIAAQGAWDRYEQANILKVRLDSTTCTPSGIFAQWSERSNPLGFWILQKISLEDRIENRGDGGICYSRYPTTEQRQDRLRCELTIVSMNQADRTCHAVAVRMCRELGGSC